MEGEELDFTPVEPANTIPTSITPLVELSPTITRPTNLLFVEVPTEPFILPTGQIDDTAPSNTKLPST